MNTRIIKLFFYFFLPFFASAVFLVMGVLISDNYYFALLGCLCLLALSPVMIIKKLDLFEPIVLIYIATLIGGTARAILLAFDGFENYPFIMQGYTLDVVFEYGFFILLGMISLSVGYLFVEGRIEIKKLIPFIDLEFNKKKLNWMVIFCVLVSMVGSFLYVSNTGINFNDMDSISNKRASEVGNMGIYTAHGYLTMLSAFSEYALYIIFTFLMFKGGGRFYFFLLPLLFLLACFIPFVSSSRMDILLIMINMGIVYYYAKGKVVPVKALIVVIVVSFLLVSFMGQLRAMAQERDTVNMENPIVAVIASGNFVDITRFSVILNEMPEKMDFLYGQSLISWVMAPVPRSLWPEKPQISLGPLVRDRIYGLPTRNNGFPPGIYTEGYMNFGIVGLILLPFFFGALLRLLYNSFVVYLELYPVALIVFVGFAWRFSFGAIGLNFSQALVQVLTDIVALYLLCLLSVSKRQC
jgi:oligosaccharide repeat unit polymerase